MPGRLPKEPEPKKRFRDIDPDRDKSQESWPTRPQTIIEEQSSDSPRSHKSDRDPTVDGSGLRHGQNRTIEDKIREERERGRGKED